MRRIALLASALILAAGLVGCGSDEPEAGQPEASQPEASQPADPTSTASHDGSQQIRITFEGDQAPPVERVQVDAGETVELVITSDAPGELHVHSDPEQSLAYDAGTTTVPLTIDRPGVVEVERHEPEALVLQLEVR
ncbi:hypothetical protein [Nocardioides sp.]|uniref:hypothetical protein n=1 Tax=Nocardioides sp. TaxID=35761 RepID=UPI002ED5D0C9